MYQYRSEEIILPKDLFQDKKIIMCNMGFTGQITELRFRREKLQIREVKDSFRTPLGVVAEKRGKIKVKFGENAVNKSVVGLKDFKMVFKLEEDAPQNNILTTFKQEEQQPEEINFKKEI